jgi:hypothetical protein
VPLLGRENGEPPVLPRYETARFRQIAADKGFLWALGYSLGHWEAAAANALAEQLTRVALSAFVFTPKKEDWKGVETLAFRDYLKLKEEDNYYGGRWAYIKKVIDIVKKVSPEKVLELGPRRMPIVRTSDIMDIYAHGPALEYLHDAGKTPWPVGDKAYDLFIALQVWEHLEGRQAEAFKEVMRVAGSAILSFPYKRYCPGNCHHGVDEKVISEWTLHVRPKKIIKAGTVIIYLFEF